MNIQTNDIKKLNIEGLISLCEFLTNNQNNPELVIRSFGMVKNNNGFGTYFLKPENPFFDTAWVALEENNVKSVCFGSKDLGLKIAELYHFYNNCKEGFDRYDDEYVYVFYNTDNNYNIQISSKMKLLDTQKIITNVPLNLIRINLTL